MYSQLIQILGNEKVSQNETILFQHSKDESYHPPVEPDIVVFPASKEDIIEIVQFANRQQVPIVPFGAGSGLEGQATPIKKGISISFQKMNKIVSFNPEDMLITVQPGMTRLELNEAINKHGFFFLLILVQMRQLAE